VLASWQLEQLPVTPLWICTLVGAGVAKALPGALLVADDVGNTVWRVTPAAAKAAAPH